MKVKKKRDKIKGKKKNMLINYRLRVRIRGNNNSKKLKEINNKQIDKQKIIKWKIKNRPRVKVRCDSDIKKNEK